MTTLTPSESSGGEKVRRSRLIRIAQPYANPYFAGILLGIVLFFAFFITGINVSA